MHWVTPSLKNEAEETSCADTSVARRLRSQMTLPHLSPPGCGGVGWGAREPKDLSASQTQETCMRLS